LLPVDSYFEIFLRIKKRSKVIQFAKDNSDIYDFSGCYPVLSDKGIIKGYHLIIPEINSLIAKLIYIHEKIHAIILESRIGREYDVFCESEISPIFYEWLYIENQRNEKLRAFYREYFAFKKEFVKGNHLMALKEQDRLKEEYYRSPQLILKKQRVLIFNEEEK